MSLSKKAIAGLKSLGMIFSEAEGWHHPETTDANRCKCGTDNKIVNQCGCDPNNMPTRTIPEPMSIYPGDKPYNGTITEKQFQLLQAAPDLLNCLTRLEIQLSYQHAPDTAMLQVMLADVRATIAQATQ